MNRMLAAVCTVGLTALVAACSQQKAGTGKVDNVAVVDGIAISRSAFNEYARVATNKQVAELNAAQKADLLENLIHGAVLAKEAEATSLEDQELVRAKLELHRLDVLSRAATEHFMKDHRITEEEVRAQYDFHVANTPKDDYRASHILVPTEDEARNVLAQLKAGGDFAQIARKVSTDRVSGERGGDLEWFSPGSVTPAFADALLRLKKGETTPLPVQTEFGWHVIRVTGTRPAVPPDYESVRENLAKQVENKKTKAWIDGLVGKAKITRSL